MVLAMADDASRAHRIEYPAEKVASCEDAYGVLRYAKDRGAHDRAMSFVRDATRERGLPKPPAPQHHTGIVARRTEGAYAAAALLRTGKTELPRALAIANEVVKDFGDEGRLYSTVDSVAAIALMMELQASGLVEGAGGKAKVDGRDLAIADAMSIDDPHEIEATGGVVAVEVTRIVEERWDKMQASIPLRVALESEGKLARSIKPADALDLRVTLEDGYKPGDLLHVCLPDALTRLQGGGQVKRFAIDFEGKNEVVVPLVATSKTQGDGQRWAICVRNMFEEERAGNPGTMLVRVG
jgi:hypothetical protein